jgi:hypothetical protein
MNGIVWFAVVLLIMWLALRLALAITSGLLHLLWIAAIIMLVLWMVGTLRKSGNP